MSRFRITARINSASLFLLLAFFVALLGGCADESTSNGTMPATVIATTGEADAASYTFAVMGDSHTVGLDNGILARATESAIANGAEFIVHTGDVSNIGAREEFERYRDFIDSAGITFYSVPGNHDLASIGGTGLFAAVVGPAYQSFEYKGDGFILTDYTDEEFGIDAEQMSWIAAELAAGADRPRQFIFGHIPVGDMGVLREESEEDHSFLSGQMLLEEASRYNNIGGYFFGHFHGYLAYKIGDTGAWVTGGAGAPPYPVEAFGYYHYLLVRIGGVEVEVEVVSL